MERSLPGKITVQKLIGIISRLFHLDARKVNFVIAILSKM